MKCLNCKAETNNPKYCSRSCSAIKNNTLYPKRIRAIRYCEICNGKVKNYNKRCNKCWQILDWSKITYEEVVNKRNYQKNSRIRELARSVYRISGKPLICFHCKYSKHVEICHIKAISSFDKNTKISEINNINNLICLCRNCHWEFDNNLLILK